MQKQNNNNSKADISHAWRSHAPEFHHRGPDVTTDSVTTPKILWPLLEPTSVVLASQLLVRLPVG